MEINVKPGILRGEVTVPPSKSCFIREVVCAVLAEGETFFPLSVPDLCDDCLAALDCVKALGASVQTEKNGIRIRGGDFPETAVFPCGESAALFRILLAVSASLGIRAVLQRSGTLKDRPAGGLEKILEEHGCSVTFEGENVTVCGKLRPGDYTVDGAPTSQSMTAMLIALSVCEGENIITGTGFSRSEYVTLTGKILRRFGCKIENDGEKTVISGEKRLKSPGIMTTEADFSSAAALMCAAAGMKGSELTICGIGRDSSQPDRAITELLSAFGASVTFTGRTDDHEITVHRMKLNPEPFAMMKDSRKTVELRLFDEKRQKIRAGDRIEFTETVTGETLRVSVEKLYRFDSFAELYNALPLTECGYTEETVGDAGPSDMERYYSAEEQAKYGVVGIGISRLPEASERITVKGNIKRPMILNASDTPDLIPVLAALLSSARGASVIKGVSRLRGKESDRVQTVLALLKSAGIEAAVEDDFLRIRGTEKLRSDGFFADCFHDHRIAMAAAVLAFAHGIPMTVRSAEAVNKSFPAFFEILKNHTV